MAVSNVVIRLMRPRRANCTYHIHTYMHKKHEHALFQQYRSCGLLKRARFIPPKRSLSYVAFDQQRTVSSGQISVTKVVKYQSIGQIPDECGQKSEELQTPNVESSRLMDFGIYARMCVRMLVYTCPFIW
jgi:hypothetical protein